MSTEKPLSQNAIGRKLGLSSGAMSKMRAQGCPMDSVEAVRTWREGHLNIAQRKPELNAHPVADDAREDHDAARTRQRIAEANMAELNESKMRRELINISAVEREMAIVFATVRDALLQLPARISPLLAGEADAHTIHTILDNEIRQALHNLAAAPERVRNSEGAFQ